MDRKIFTMNYFKMLLVTVGILIYVIIISIASILNVFMMSTYLLFWIAMLPITRLLFSTKWNGMIYDKVEEYWDTLYELFK